MRSTRLRAARSRLPAYSTSGSGARAGTRGSGTQADNTGASDASPRSVVFRGGMSVGETQKADPGSCSEQPWSRTRSSSLQGIQRPTCPPLEPGSPPEPIRSATGTSRRPRTGDLRRPWVPSRCRAIPRCGKSREPDEGRSRQGLWMEWRASEVSSHEAFTVSGPAPLPSCEAPPSLHYPRTPGDNPETPLPSPRVNHPGGSIPLFLPPMILRGSNRTLLRGAHCKKK